MADIFGSPASGGMQAWRMGRAIISFPSNNVGLAVMSIEIDYSRPIQPLNPINSTTKYLVVGESTGTINIGLMVGPAGGIEAFVKEFSDPCKPHALTVTPGGNITQCKTGGTTESFVLDGVLLTQFQITASASDGPVVMAQARASGMFTNMKAGGGGGGEKGGAMAASAAGAAAGIAAAAGTA